jgi:hypothetical protein
MKEYVRGRKRRETQSLLHHHHMRPFTPKAQQQKQVHVWRSGAAAQSSKEKEEIGWVLFGERRRRRQQKKRKKRCKKKRSPTTFGRKVKNLNGPSSSHPNRRTAHNSLVSKATLPKLGCIRFRDAKLIAGEDTVGKDGFKFAKHVREDETEFCQIPPIMRVFIKHLDFAFFEQLYGLLALSHQIINEDIKVLVGM